MEAEFSLRTQQRIAFGQRYVKLFGHTPSKRRVEQFIKEDKDAATVRFTAEFTRVYQRGPTQNEIDAFVIDWREPKLTEILTPRVRELQRKRISDDWFAKVRATVEAAITRSTQAEQICARGDPNAAVDQGIDHFLERLSVAPLCNVLDSALRFGASEFGDLDPVKLRFAGDSLNRFHPLGELSASAMFASLSDEQRHAVECLANSRDGIGVLIGDAGTGKTHTLKALNESARPQVVVRIRCPCAHDTSHRGVAQQRLSGGGDRGLVPHRQKSPAKRARSRRAG